MSDFEYEKWIRELKNGIQGDWLDFFTKNELLNSFLNSILTELHWKYQPKTDGNWSASPKWTEIFQWTSCPLHSIRAIIIMKEPQYPEHFHSYHSTGYQEVFSVDWNESALSEKYKAGHNPEQLSKKGVLFLNLSLTRGSADDSDFKVWWEFTKLMLKEIGKIVPQDVLLLKFCYNREHINSFFVNEIADGRLCLITPEESPRKGHLAFFNEEDIARHAESITQHTFEEYDRMNRKLEEGETEAKKVIIEMHRQVTAGSREHDGCSRQTRLDMSDLPTLVALT